MLSFEPHLTICRPQHIDRASATHATHARRTGARREHMHVPPTHWFASGIPAKYRFQKFRKALAVSTKAAGTDGGTQGVDSQDPG